MNRTWQNDCRTQVRRSGVLRNITSSELPIVRVRLRRPSASLLALVLAAGAARSQVDDMPVGSPSVAYVDIEVNSAVNMAVFHDRYRDANAWVSEIDPPSGAFVSPDGLDLFIDDHMSTYDPILRNSPLFAGNYAEWVIDNGEHKVLYTRLEGRRQRMYLQDLYGGPREPALAGLLPNLLAAIVLASFALGLGQTGRRVNAGPAAVPTVQAQQVTPAGAGPARPNIVVVTLDDLDGRSLTEAVQAGLMPNLKRYIIDHGVTFSNSHVINSVCCPSRSTLLTGQYSHNHGLTTNRADISLLNDFPTLPTWLHDSGYRTGIVGKYLNGYGSTDMNHDQVVDQLDRIYVPPGWDDWQTHLGHANQYDYVMNDNGVLVQYGSASSSYQTDVIGSRAVQFINEAEAYDSMPFFLLIAPTAPHVEVPSGPEFWDEYSDAWAWDIRPAPRHLGSVVLPLPQPPSFNELDVTDKPLWVQARPLLTDADVANLTRQYQNRIAAIRSVDDMVGKVLNAINKKGEWSSTVFLFTSDNGYLLGQHRLAKKEAPYEESIRVPLYVRQLWVKKAGVTDAYVLNTDLAPTIAELAGVVPGLPVDGKSLVPLLSEPNMSFRKRFLVEHWAIPEQGIFVVPDYAAVRSGPEDQLVPNQLYVEYADGSLEFYDLGTDPNQLESLHGDPSPLRTSQRLIHAQELAALKACAGGSCQLLEAE